MRRGVVVVVVGRSGLAGVVTRVTIMATPLPPSTWSVCVYGVKIKIRLSSARRDRGILLVVRRARSVLIVSSR